MTGKERLLAALNRQVPDHVPTLEWVIDSNVMERMNGTRDAIEFARRADLDGISVSLDYKNVLLEKGTNGSGDIIRNEWGIVCKIHEEYPVPIKYPLEEYEDLEGFVVPDPDASYRFDKIKKALAAFNGEKLVVGRVRDVVSQPRDLLGYENYLMSFYTDEDLVTRLMEISCDYSCRICENLHDLGVEVIVVGDDIADNNSLLMSPQMFRQMVLPHFTKLVQHAKSMGMKVIKHSDGNLNAVVKDLIDAGIDCLDPIDRRGQMDMKVLKQTYGDQIAFKGNVDCVATLVDQPLSTVRQEVAQCLLEGGQNGGLIISSSNSIHAGVNAENWKYFLEVRKELGQYPLNIELLERIAQGG